MLPQKLRKHIRQLQLKKYREEFHEFSLEGIKGVGEALTSNFKVILLAIEDQRKEEKNIQKILKVAQKKKITIEFCGKKDIGEIKTTDTFPGVLAVLKRDVVTIQRFEDGPVIALNGTQDPGNLGTIIRTADWFGIKNILLSEECVELYNPKVVRSTMGSIFHVNVCQSHNFISDLKKLKQNSYTICALDMNGENVNVLKPKEKVIYVFGNESHGIDGELDKLIDNRYTIPGKGQAESLNVAVAAGIIMNKIKV